MPPLPPQEWGLFIGHGSRLTVGADLAGIKKPPVTGAGGVGQLMLKAL